MKGRSAQPPPRSVSVVGISGPPGSCTSALAARVARRTGSPVLPLQLAWYLDATQGSAVASFDRPESFDGDRLVTDLDALCARLIAGLPGGVLDTPRYGPIELDRWAVGVRGGHRQQAEPNAPIVVVVEGSMLFAFEAVAQRCAVRVLLTSNLDECVLRRFLAREHAAHGTPALFAAAMSVLSDPVDAGVQRLAADRASGEAHVSRDAMLRRTTADMTASHSRVHDSTLGGVTRDEEEAAALARVTDTYERARASAAFAEAAEAYCATAGVAWQEFSETQDRIACRAAGPHDLLRFKVSGFDPRALGPIADEIAMCALHPRSS